MKHKKTLLQLGVISTLMLLAVMVNPVRAQPNWFPENVDVAGYDKVWESTTSVHSFLSNDSANNLTAYIQLWLKEGNETTNASIIGATMLEIGNEIFTWTINWSKLSTAEKLEISILANLTVNELTNITLSWTLMVEILKTWNPSLLVVEKNLTNVDKTVIVEADNSLYFNQAIFSIQEDKALLVVNLDAEQSWIDWLNMTGADTAIKQALEACVGAFWTRLLVVINVFQNLFNDHNAFVSTSSIASVDTNGIVLSEATSQQDMEQFSSEWGYLVSTYSPGEVPGFLPVVVLAAISSSVILVLLSLKKRIKK